MVPLKSSPELGFYFAKKTAPHGGGLPLRRRDARIKGSLMGILRRKLVTGGALRFRQAAAVAVLSGCMAACGNSIYTTSPGPAEPLLDDEWPRSPTPDVSVTASGFQPQVLHVNAPVTVIFTNNDTVAHTLRNAPGLGWDNCPEMNTPISLAPGQVARIPFQEADAVCTYEDAAQPEVTAFQGYVAIHRSS